MATRWLNWNSNQPKPDINACLLNLNDYTVIKPCFLEPLLPARSFYSLEQSHPRRMLLSLILLMVDWA